MGTLLQDLRFAWRVLVKRPVFTAVAVFSLALGIGANTTIFSVVDALLLKSLPVERPGELVELYTRDVKNPGLPPLSHLNWRDLRDQAGSFSGVLGYDWVGMSALVRGEPSLVTGQLVSGNYFQVLGVKPALGRTFQPDEDGAPGAHPVAVLSYRFFEQHMGGDRAVVGSTLVLNQHPFTVIGVAAPSYTGTDTGVAPDLWVPIAMNRLIRPDAAFNWYDTRRGLFLFTIARLKPGVSLAKASAEVRGIASRLEQEFPADNRGRTFELRSLAEATVPPAQRGGLIKASLLLMSVVGLVLLIACANVANLLLARASSRRREIAIRLSQGASRGRLVRQLLTESLLLALSGGALGLLVTFWAGRVLLAFLAPFTGQATPVLDLAVDSRILGFTLGVSLLTGLLFGLAPALQSSKPEVVSALKSQSPGGGTRRRLPGLRTLLVAGQVALSLVSLIGAGLFVRSLGAAQRISPGFDPSHLMVAGFDLGLQGFDAPRGEQLFRQIRERVGSLPGVAAVSIAQGGPFQGTAFRSVFLEGEQRNENGILVQVNLVDAGYLQTLGVPLMRGRGIDERDRLGEPLIAVVNQTMADKFWPHQNPVGQRFHFFGEPPVEVVGVARDMKYNAIGEDPQPYVYQPLAQHFTGAVSLVARSAGDPGPVLATAERELHALVPDMPLIGAATVPQLLSNSLVAPRLGASLLALFGALALALAAGGIYGTISYTVAQRAREIGIRMALGAQARSVLAMILSQGMIVVGAGLLAGLLLAVALTRFAAGLLFGISPTDPLAFATTCLILLVASLLATLLPARRATRIDPILVLRQE